MFHEDQVHLRFELQQTRGDTIIRVMPKRGNHSEPGRGERSERSERSARFEQSPRRSSKAPPRRTESEERMPTPGAPGSSTETFHALRPIPKKAPLPPPPSFNEEKPQAAKPMPVKAEPGPDYGEELSPPDPPPGEHWEEYVDGDNTWFFYSGPKGQWCCQGLGQEVLPYDPVNLE